MLDWKEIKGAWYCYRNGQMVKGWVQDENSKWYYLYPNETVNYGITYPMGAMAVDWVELDSMWYYFYPKKTVKYGITYPMGAMTVDWTEINSMWYYFYPKKTINYGITYPIGAMAVDWVQLDSKWYYFLKEKTEYSGNTHYKGEMVASTTITINNKSYTFDANGVMQEASSGSYSEKLLEFTESQEGFVDHWDHSSSYGAIGYGTDASGNVGKRLKEQGVTSCTRTEAAEWLKEELNEWANTIKNRCDRNGYQINQYCFDCMVDICYQWGNQQWRILDLLANGNIDGAKAKIRTLGYTERDNARCDVLDGKYTLNE